MRLGRLYAKRTKLGPTFGRSSVDPDRDGWVVYWYAAGGRWWKWWPLHANRVAALPKGKR